jgi:hypothetical protein
MEMPQRGAVGGLQLICTAGDIGPHFACSCIFFCSPRDAALPSFHRGRDRGEDRDRKRGSRGVSERGSSREGGDGSKGGGGSQAKEEEEDDPNMVSVLVCVWFARHIISVTIDWMPPVTTQLLTTQHL